MKFPLCGVLSRRIRMACKPVALITGGAGGIGRVCSARLAQEYDVVITDLDEQIAVKAALETASLGMACDVSSEESINNCVARIEEERGPIELLVTLAGIIQERHFAPEEFPQQAWDDVFAINNRGTWICCRIVGTRMVSRKRGSIVTISSVMGHRSWPAHAYGPAKAAVLSMTQNLAVAWGRSGVRVNSVSPGFTITQRVEELGKLRGKTNDSFALQTALGRWVLPEEVAEAIAFLASDRASAITGVDLPVDAGWLPAVNWPPRTD
jgi:NAD(P)-dependent dehydrogenase (short-subunit alcohol dehydrogenase family)